MLAKILIHFAYIPTKRKEIAIFVHIDEKIR